MPKIDNITQIRLLIYFSGIFLVLIGVLFDLGFNTVSEVALFIGFIELAQILTPKLELNSGFWKWVQNLNFGSMGYLLVGLFIISWGVFYLMWKILRLETV